MTPYSRFVRFAIQSTFPLGPYEPWVIMNKKDLYFVSLMVAVLGVFMTLWLISRKAPAMTSRPEHGDITKETGRETCFKCHNSDGIAPQPAHHPKKGLPDEMKNRPNATPTPCYECHKLPRASVAALFLPGPERGD